MEVLPPALWLEVSLSGARCSGVGVGAVRVPAAQCLFGVDRWRLASKWRTYTRCCLCYSFPRDYRADHVQAQTGLLPPNAGVGSTMNSFTTLSRN